MDYLLRNSGQDIFYYLAKSGLLNCIQDKSPGRQLKLPNPCRIPEVLPEIRRTPIILTLTLHFSVSFSAFSGLPLTLHYPC